MPYNEPRTIKQFARWLEAAYDKVDFFSRYVDPDFYDQIDADHILADAERLVCRFGGGHTKTAASPSMTPCEGLVRLGQLLAWTTKELVEPPDLLSVEQVAIKLGVSTRTIWRRLAANEIPPAHPSDGPTRWRADDIQAWVELGPEKKRGR